MVAEGPLVRHGFDDVGIKCSLHQEIGLAGLARLFLEHSDELSANDLALLLGVLPRRPIS